MSQPLDFQSMIFTLQQFWAQKGCLIWQPYNTQVGAGTNNPATFLRVLGPEPWKIGYVEPSVRPDDGRYGENPNRLQQHTQFQLILKPDPGNPQELYLESLMALGIDPRQHDIRFVEDNWESPALGAWGLGWEVWCDGQEITQFTYFQQAGGQIVDPVAVEITYGLERIAMTLQRVRNFRDIRWSQNIKYGDVFLQGEQEHSKYYFETADVARMQKMYDLFEEEGRRAMEAGLVLPAFDYILKCSHTFNVLDARGAIGVTERQAYFGRMRESARRVAEAYLQQRQNLEYPFLVESSAVSEKPAKAVLKPVAAPAAFLLEIGTEELPAGDLQAAMSQLQARMPAWLDELRLSHGVIQVLGTPRRLVVYVKTLAARQEDRSSVVKGPPASRAFDVMGLPTPAAQGFAKSRGVPVSELQVRSIDGGEYMVALLDEPGRSSVEVLSEALPAWVAGIRFDKGMRWNSSNVTFSRPIRWLLALHGDSPVPFEYAGLQSASKTRGLRFRQPLEQVIDMPQAYFALLRAQGIIIDPVARKQAIREQVKALMTSAGGKAEVDEGLLDEVNNLVEAPTAMLGKIDAAHLSLPADVVVSVMKKHQRYFPVYAHDGSLLPNFIAVRNGDDQHMDVVVDGNEQVIGARYADAAFFINDDLKHRLEDFLPRLGTLTFQFKLGSMLDKSQRIEHLVERLLPLMNMTPAEGVTVRRAARLCKADLVSHMVIEMTALQGIMGRFYAQHSGESRDVAEAIYEHYLPRSASDRVAPGKPGLLIGLADRLDSLAGLFAAGLAPSGTKDPFAQRRTALGLVQSLMAWGIDFDLRQGLALASESLPVASSSEVQRACFDFITGRMRSQLIEQESYRFDVVDAVLAEQGHNPAGVLRGVKELTEWTKRSDWSTILAAYARCVRITRDQQKQYPVNPASLVEDVEKDLWQSVSRFDASGAKFSTVNDFFANFMPVIPVINRFFEGVLVMAEDEQVRANRLGLLQKVSGMAAGTADISKLEGF
jgi:glycyl-tRNA synthetase